MRATRNSLVIGLIDAGLIASCLVSGARFLSRDRAAARVADAAGVGHRVRERRDG